MIRRGMINGRQFIIGIGCLLAGIVIYVVARQPGVVFVPAPLNLSHFFSPVLIRLSGPLPAFFHVVALSLLTASIVRPGQRGIIVICLGWTSIHMVFELGQWEGIAVWLATGLPVGLGNGWWFEPIDNYVSHGTFDTYDLLAMVLGAVIAYTIMRHTRSVGVLRGALVRRVLVVPLVMCGLVSILASGDLGDDDLDLSSVVARDDDTTTNSGVSVIIDVLQNDGQDSNTISEFTQAIDAAGNVQEGSVESVNFPEQLQYSPPMGFEGTVTFTYTIVGAGIEFDFDSDDTATVTVTVEPPN